MSKFGVYYSKAIQKRKQAYEFLLSIYDKMSMEIERKSSEAL